MESVKIMIASIDRNLFVVWLVKLFLGLFITEMMTISATLLASVFNALNPSKKLQNMAKNYYSLMC